MKIRFATPRDLDRILKYDKHISEAELKNAIALSRVYVAEEGENFAGWLRFNLFWDNTPFLNLLYLLEPYRGKGYGKELISRWEADMKKRGFGCVMTSTAANETAQYFYEKTGYQKIGGFYYLDDPYEILFQKKL